MAKILELKNKLKTKKIKDNVQYLINDTIGEDAFDEDGYKIIDNEVEARKLEAQGWKVDVVRFFVCMKE